MQDAPGYIFDYSSVEWEQAGAQPSHHVAPQIIQVLNVSSLPALPQVPQCVCSNTISSTVSKPFVLSICLLAKLQGLAAQVKFTQFCVVCFCVR